MNSLYDFSQILISRGGRVMKTMFKLLLIAVLVLPLSGVSAKAQSTKQQIEELQAQIRQLQIQNQQQIQQLQQQVQTLQKCAAAVGSDAFPD